MKEERRFVEKTLWRLDAFDNDAAGDRTQSRVLLRRQLAAGEHDDRNLHQRIILSNMLKQLEPRHVGQLEIEHDAIGWFLPKNFQSFAAVVGCDDFNVPVAEQLDYALELRRIVLDDKQPLPRIAGIFAKPSDRRLQFVHCCGLVDECKSAARQSMLPILVERDDLHGNVPGARILLQLAQHRPAKHIW